MRTNLDFSPFIRSSIGFDRIFSLLDEATRFSANGNGPAYDIVRAGDDGYRIVLAVPGYEMTNLSITQEGNLLTVSGKLPETETPEHLHMGLRLGNFSQRFELADYVDVTNAELKNGLLTIALKQELPEAMKPHTIPIGKPADKQIESRKAA
jgi:molecular chaperone IbpA